MSAEGRAKLWAREIAEKLAPKPHPERQPHHRIKVMRAVLCEPKPDRKRTDETHPDDREWHHSERELFFDADAERAARRRQRDSSAEMAETHAVATGDDSGEDGLT